MLNKSVSDDFVIETSSPEGSDKNYKKNLQIFQIADSLSLIDK